MRTQKFEFPSNNGYLCFGPHSAGYISDKMSKQKKLIYQAFARTYSRIDKNKYLTTEDKKNFRTLVSLIAIEMASDEAHRLYKLNLSSPKAQCITNIKAIKLAIQYTMKKEFRDLPDEYKRKIENKIMSGEKRKGPSIREKVLARFEGWKKQTLAELQNPVAMTHQKRPQIGHLAAGV